MRMRTAALLAALAALFAGAAQAAFSNASGTLPFTGNQLAELYFDVDFGSTAHTETWDIALSWTGNSGVRVQMFDCDRAASASNNTAWAAAVSGAFTNPPHTPGSGTLPAFYTTASYSGVHRFFITVAPADTTVSVANNITVTISNAAQAGTSAGFQNHFWTTQNATAIGTSGASAGFMRNYLQQTFGIATLGGASDQIQFEIATTFPGTAAPGVVSLRVLSAAGTTGSVDFDFYDMDGTGGQTPNFTISVAASASDAKTHTTAALSGTRRFRVIMRAGTGFAGSSLTNFWITFGTNVQINDFLGTDPMPQQATPKVTITPAGTSISATTTLNASGGSGTPTYNWSLQGTPPAGVSLSASTGTSVDLVLTGGPTGSVTVRCTNGSGPEFDEETFTLTTGGGGGGLSITTSSLPNGTINVAYNFTVAATGGTPPYTWSASGLPAGYTINPSTGAITGTTTSSGTFPVMITVTDSATPTPNVVTSNFNLVIGTGGGGGGGGGAIGGGGGGGGGCAVDLGQTTGMAGLIVLMLLAVGAYRRRAGQ